MKFKIEIDGKEVTAKYHFSSDNRFTFCIAELNEQGDRVRVFNIPRAALHAPKGSKFITSGCSFKLLQTFP